MKHHNKLFIALFLLGQSCSSHASEQSSDSLETASGDNQKPRPAVVSTATKVEPEAAVPSIAQPAPKSQPISTTIAEGSSDTISAAAVASKELEVALWPNRAHPSMRIYFPAASDSPKAAMLVFRGGAYRTDKGSGYGAAEFLTKNGMIGIEVEYGTATTNEAYPANFSDSARAMRLVRKNAKAWGIDPTKIGVMGFSAGGHVASLLSTQPEHYKNPQDDLAGTVSARPDLAVLSYPVISFVDGYYPGAFLSSTENFFGKDKLTESERKKFSSELNVKSNHPPVFIWTTNDDSLVPANHTQLFADACKKAGVPVEMIRFPNGAHGLGLALDGPADVRTWTDSFLKWSKRYW